MKTEDAGEDDTVNFKLQEMETEDISVKYDSEIFEDMKIIDTFNYTYYLVIIALILAVLTVVFAVFCRSEKSQDGKNRHDLCITRIDFSNYCANVPYGCFARCIW